MGLEAASRGAASVVMIERSALVVRALRENVTRLGADRIEVHCADVLDWLARSRPTPVELCFLDPPFAAGLLAPTLHRLADRGWLVDGAWLYIEADRRAPELELPDDWRWLRRKQAGQVRYGLVEAGGERTTAL